MGATKRDFAEALMDVLNQAAGVENHPNSIVADNALSAYEDACDLLVENGLAEDLGRGRYMLLWDRLDGFEAWEA